MKYSIRASLLPHPRKDGTHTIRLRVSWNASRVDISLPAGISPSDWDNRSQQPKRAAKRAKTQFDNAIADINHLFELAHIQRRTPTADEIRAAVSCAATTTNTLPSTIADLLPLFITHQAELSAWAPHTAQRYRTWARHLTAHSGSKPISQFSDTLFRSFIDYLYTQGLSNSSAAKLSQQTRTFLRWAVDNGHLSDTSYTRYRPKFKGEGAARDIIYLSQDELSSLMTLDLSNNPCLSRVRDIFLFCCFTGIRYSDVSALTWDSIHTDHISIVTQKTADPLKIELNNISQSILNRYLSDAPSYAQVFPIISNQKFNDYLKNLGRLANINEPVRRVYWVRSERHEEVKPKYQLLSSHCARRTFVVTALTLGIQSDVIMKWTGHTDHKTMRPYVAIVDQLKAASMQKFNTIPIPSTKEQPPAQQHPSPEELPHDK